MHPQCTAAPGLAGICSSCSRGPAGRQGPQDYISHRPPRATRRGNGGKARSREPPQPAHPCPLATLIGCPARAPPPLSAPRWLVGGSALAPPPAARDWLGAQSRLWAALSGCPAMEGALLKWTNYLSGWQPRYFVLDGGVLSYYDSQDDVGKGSKGSVKMAVCEIKVHPSDPTRMELAIPGEQYFYLKARGAAERQKWLVALGSSKACLGDSRSQKDKDMQLSSESLGRKLSELRLYCDVLTQQVLDVQESMRPQDNDCLLDLEKMTEASSLLRATCSQFISTLEECMKFANSRLAPELYQPSPAPLPQDFVGTKLPPSHRVRRSLSHTGIVSPDRGAEPPRPPGPPQKGAVTVLRNLEEMVMFRWQQWGPQGPEDAILEEREGARLPAREAPADAASGDEQK